MNLKNLIAAFAFLLPVLVLGQQEEMAPQREGFLENKGQIIDQKNRPNKDVLFLLPGQKANMQLRKSGFSYDLYSIEYFQRDTNRELDFPHEQELEDSCAYHYHRIDVEWIKPNRNIRVSTLGKSKDYRNYYTTGTPKGGVTDVRHYQKVLYHNVWNNIDVEFLVTDKGPKYNYIVRPGGDINDIQWRYKGADSVKLEEGAIQVFTSQGEFQESIPLSFIQETGDSVNIEYKMLKKGFGFRGPFESNQTLVIDPVPNLVWSTYWGWSGNNFLNEVTYYGSDIYLSGSTTASNNVATTGAYQTTLSGNYDAILASLQKNRSKNWVTYIGGSSRENTPDFKLYDNRIYFYSATKSTNFPTTTGVYQTLYAGGTDGFVSKFSLSGSLVWSSFVGGSDEEAVIAITFSGSQIFIAGTTESTNNIATTGSHSSTKGVYSSYSDDEGYIMALDTSFTSKAWGTYLGGNERSWLTHMEVGCDNKLYYSGSTYATNFATVGAHQIVKPSSTGKAGYVGKISLSGTQEWRTYYGNTRTTHVRLFEDDCGLFTMCRMNGSINSGSYCLPSNWNFQIYNVFHSLDSNGYRSEKFRFPSNSLDIVPYVHIKDSSTIYVGGSTYLNLTGLVNSFQGSKSGNSDAYFAKFKNDNLSWYTYFGTSSDETLIDLSTTQDSILVVGRTTLQNVDTTDSVFGVPTSGYYSPFVTLFSDSCIDLTSNTYGSISGSLQVCPYDTVEYSINHQLYTEYYDWTVPSGAQILSGQGNTRLTVVFDTISGNITVTPRNSCDTAATITLAVNVNLPPSQPTISPSDTLIICPSDTITLTSDVLTNISWNTGAVTSSIAVDTAGIYVLTHLDTSSCGVDRLDSVLVEWNTAIPDTPAVNPSGLTKICQGDSVQLSAPISQRYRWNTGDTTQNIWVGQSGYYSVAVRDSLACWSFVSDSIQVQEITPLAKPSVSPPGPISICAGDSVELMGTGDWSTGVTDTSICVKTAGTYYYSISDTNNACPDVYSDSVVVTVVALSTAPVITYAGNDTICAGDSVQLSTNYAASNLWNTGDTTQSIWVSQTGDYHVFQLNALDCPSDTSNVIHIEVQQPPTKPMITAGGPLAFCQGDSVELTVSSLHPVEWSTGDTTSSIWVMASGSYYVQTKAQTACSEAFSDTTIVTVNPLPATPSIAALGDSALCDPLAAVTLSSNYLSGNNWSNMDTSQSILVSTPGMVQLWRTNAFGCMSDTVAKTVHQSIFSLGADTSICEGDGLLLTTGLAGSYLWSTGANGMSTAVLPSSSTQYWVQNTTTGCSDTLLVTVHPTPVAQFGITPMQGPVPLDITATNSSTGGSSYLWSFGDGGSSSATNPTHSYAEPGSYTVMLVATNEFGCSDTAYSSIVEAIPATYFYIPNSFSPNNDQINDYFEMFNIPEPYVFMVFDRWGNKVYHSDDYQNNWDGSYKGETLQQGAYTYRIEYRYINPNSEIAAPLGALRILTGVLYIHP